MQNDEIIKKIKESFHNTDDIKFREFSLQGTELALAYLDGFSSKELIERSIVEALTDVEGAEEINREFLQKNLNYFEEIVKAEDYEDAINIIADGDAALFNNKNDDIYILSFKSYPTRSISEPETSMVVKGPREGFIEDMKANTILLRRRIRSKNLVFRYLKAGRYTKTNIALCYIDGIANLDLVSKLADKINSIDIDGIIDSSYIAKFLEVNHYSIFKQEGTSEKPDIVTSKLLEGKVAVIVDGSPIVLTYPYALVEDLQDSHDYYTRSARAVMLRILRLLAVITAVFLPCMYVVMQEFHYEIFPMKLLQSVAGATENLPLSPSLEMLFVILLFEILNEASIRMPKYVGMALGVVGAIVLGDTGVKSGLISSPAVLIASLSSIGMYCLPDLVGSISILRIVFVLLCTVSGLFGLIATTLITIGYIARIEIYDTPYLAPYAPIIPSDQKDGVNKVDLLDMRLRPKSYNNKNEVRLKNGK